MKKILLAVLLTFILVLPVNAQGAFSVDQEEITVETGDAIKVNYENANGEIEVDVCNEYDQEMWAEYFNSEENGTLSIKMPECNPLKTAYLHIINGEAEEVVKVSFVKPHEHQPHYVDAVRPTDTEAGSKPYFYCDCGKFFEDRGCTIEITEPIDEWAYLASIPKEQWGEGNPVPYVEEIDGKNITDPEKPNPTWAVEDVETYYENEEIEVQTELEERKVDKLTNTSTNQLNTSTDMSTNQLEAGEPVVLSVQPVEEELTLWEQIKMFFINLFK